MTMYTETATIFPCNDNRLVGIATIPTAPRQTGVLILVGGPQYRVGSHRQFTMLARQLAEAGIPSFRFDYSGMGDSEGGSRDFSAVRDDILAALDRFFELVPELSNVAVWGLCDAASAALMFCVNEPRVAGMILVNPWVHSGDYSPEVKLSMYYGSILSGTDTWRRLLTGKIEIVPSMREFIGDAGILMKKILNRSFGVPLRHPYVEGMLEGLERTNSKVVFILGEQDLTAREFLSLIANDSRWNKAVSNERVVIHKVAEADHTFSAKRQHHELVQLTIDSVTQLSIS